MHISPIYRFKVLKGRSGDHDVLIGFAPAAVLCAISFVDILDEVTEKGYQRRFNRRHSLDFRNYIQQPNSTTIPLTFNLRPEKSRYWEVLTDLDGDLILEIKDTSKKVLSQVDCQHRLGFMEDSGIEFTFMIYVGLSVQEEMSVFSVINSKSKGLSRSLTDFHDLKLIDNIEKEKPELVVAIRLNQDSDSPWYQQLDLGGNRASGMQRRASLRTMQKAVRRFIKETPQIEGASTEEIYSLIKSFWYAVTLILEDQWGNPRKHLISKGIGVYALMTIAADLCREHLKLGKKRPSEGIFIAQLEEFLPSIDWTSSGPFKGLGGESGVKKAVEIIRDIRRSSSIRVVK